MVHGTADGKRRALILFENLISLPLFLEIVHFKHSATLAKSLTTSRVQYDLKVRN